MPTSSPSKFGSVARSRSRDTIDLDDRDEITAGGSTAKTPPTSTGKGASGGTAFTHQRRHHHHNHYAGPSPGGKAPLSSHSASSPSHHHHHQHNIGNPYKEKGDYLNRIVKLLVASTILFGLALIGFPSNSAVTTTSSTTEDHMSATTSSNKKKAVISKSNRLPKKNANVKSVAGELKKEEPQKQPAPKPPASTTTSAAAKIDIPDGITLRAFDPWPKDRQLHCSAPEPGMLEKEGQDLPKTKDGFLFIKTFKTGSSTASGINLRIAGNEAKRQKKSFNICKSRFDHVRPLRVCHPGRNKQKSFLWTIVREPSKRLVSMFFHFGVTRNKFEANGENLKNYIRNETDFLHEYYLKYLSHKEYWFTKQKDDPITVINGILRDFDFVAVTERMDESVVALSMLMNVPLADVMYLPAKSPHGASYDDQPPCDKIQKTSITDDMRRVLESDSFLNLTKWDTILYHAASRSLDRTIDKLGRTQFEKNFELYKKGQKIAAEKCLPKTIFPCSDGIWHSPNETHCVWKDSHCNAPCLNEVAMELKMWDKPSSA